MSIAEGSERRSTKQESAWLFRIWYNFDHKYPSNKPVAFRPCAASPLSRILFSREDSRATMVTIPLALVTVLHHV